MHDIDRTQAEYWGEMSGLGSGETGVGTMEFGEYEYESEGEYEGEYEGEGEGEFGLGEAEGVFSEAEVMELAAELLDVRSEAELEAFLGDLIKKAGNAIGSVVRSPIGRAIGSLAKPLIKKALPVVGGALGSMIAPGIGTAAGAGMATALGNALGLELEGLSAEDREFEVAQQLVRLGGEAVRHAASAPPAVPPAVVARTAMQAAAQKYAPGLTGQLGQPGSFGANGAGLPHHGRRHSGRWIRKGNSIILIGIGS